MAVECHCWVPLQGVVCYGGGRRWWANFGRLDAIVLCYGGGGDGGNWGSGRGTSLQRGATLGGGMGVHVGGLDVVPFPGCHCWGAIACWCGGSG